MLQVVPPIMYKSLLVYFGFTPMRIRVQLPFYEQVVLEDANNFMENPLPFNEEGQFVFVADLKEGNRQLNVYAYLFTKAVGCRKYSLKKHGRLPPTTDETMPEPELLKLCGASVACSYYYRREMEGPTISYEEAGGYTMKYDVPRARCGARCGAWDEGDRAESFRRKVKEYFDSESKKLLIENRRTNKDNTTCK